MAKVGTEAKEVESSRPKGAACPWQPSGTKASLTELDSEIDTPDPGGMPQLLREPRTLSAGLLEALRRLMRRWTATCGIAHRSGEAAEPQAKAGGPARLEDRECRSCKGGASCASTAPRAIARVAEMEGVEGVGSEAAVQGAREFLEPGNVEENSGLRSEPWAGAGSTPAEMDGNTVMRKHRPWGNCRGRATSLLGNWPAQ